MHDNLDARIVSLVGVSAGIEIVLSIILVWSKTATGSSGEIFENKTTDSDSEQLFGYDSGWYILSHHT